MEAEIRFRGTFNGQASHPLESNTTSRSVMVHKSE